MVADCVSFVGLKTLARNLLPHDSTLRALILSEPDSLLRAAGLAKIEVFSRLLYRELGRGG